MDISTDMKLIYNQEYDGFSKEEVINLRERPDLKSAIHVTDILELKKLITRVDSSLIHRFKSNSETIYLLKTPFGVYFCRV